MFRKIIKVVFLMGIFCAVKRLFFTTFSPSVNRVESITHQERQGDKKNVLTQVDPTKLLTPRQKVISKELAKVDKLYLTNDLALRLGITVRTLRRDLSSLAKVGLVKRYGKTRGVYYMKV